LGSHLAVPEMVVFTVIFGGLANLSSEGGVNGWNA
jgi:hypothetical protein